jgi:hypothetical protein
VTAATELHRAGGRPHWTELSAWRVALGDVVADNGRTPITGVRESTRRSVRTIIVHIRCRQEDRMRAKRIMANLRVADVDAAKSFYTDYLGLSTEEFNMGWVARYTSPDTTANVQLVTRDATAPEDSVISVLTDDVEGAYEPCRVSCRLLVGGVAGR